MRAPYNKVIGCGGIGKGLLFHSQLNETLGRSESRLVQLSSARDYCKLQIVFYYIAMLLADKAAVYPIGAVGDDSVGEELVSLMKRQGMCTDYIVKNRELPTMMSICLQYPDKEGCNFTASNSAGGEVTPEWICRVVQEIGVDSRTMVVAVPEIRIESRVELMRLGKRMGGFCAISIPAGEAREFERENVYSDCDLVSVNEEEAGMMSSSVLAGESLARETLIYLQNWNRNVKLCMTMGAAGAWCGQGDRLEYVAPYPARTVNTTGAGDAFLGALVSGLALGMPFWGCGEEKKALCTAPELAAVCSGLAVESADSIPEEITKDYIVQQLAKHQMEHRFTL